MVVYYGRWCIWWWRMTVPDVNVGGLRQESLCLPKVAEVNEARSVGTLQAVRQRCLDRGFPAYLPMDVMARGIAKNLHTGEVWVHQWNGLIPCFTVCAAGEDAFACAPELCFLQLCRDATRILGTGVDRRLHVGILAELGCELCGTYSRQDTKRGYKDRRVALTNVASLMFLHGRMAHESGAKCMREVVPWILEGLASPMETALYLLLCLPVWFGGLGFARPVANARIQVPVEFRGRWQWEHVVPDLWWPEVGLVVEYDSDEAHAGREREDQQRRELLQDMGKKVVVFHADDLMDDEKFRNKAESLAVHLGHRLPAIDGREALLHKRLRDALLKHRRWI